MENTRKPNKPYERRFLPCGELRTITEERTVRGYAAMFDSLSEPLWGYREVIRPGAFRKTLREGADVVFLWNHNTDEVLGRRSAGTLALIEDDVGLWIEAQLPESAGNRIESIERHDVKNMSFGFKVIKDAWTRNENNEPDLRELLEIQLFEVSTATFPAYPQTSIDLARTSGIDSITGKDGEAIYIIELEGDLSPEKVENVQRQWAEAVGIEKKLMIIERGHLQKIKEHHPCVPVWMPQKRLTQSFQWDEDRKAYCPPNYKTNNIVGTSEPGTDLHSQAVDGSADKRRMGWARQRQSESITLEENADENQ